MVEVEHPEGVSSRKLIIESMKHNVVTAYSGREALELARRCLFDVVLVHSALKDIPCEELIHQLRGLQPSLTVAAITPNGRDCGADRYVDSLRPGDMVQFFNQITANKSRKVPVERLSTTFPQDEED
jgi:DNA-binding response OmpR family regulator